MLQVFSWGEGEDGKLGHGNRLSYDKPKLVEALKSKRIRDIACGSSHSAAITSCGELYCWGLGEYGRLGLGDTSTQLRPKLVKALQGQRVIQVKMTFSSLTNFFFIIHFVCTLLVVLSFSLRLGSGPCNDVQHLQDAL